MTFIKIIHSFAFLFLKKKQINTENDNDCFVLQSFLNRAPTIDSQLHQESGLPDSIITCSGQDEHGSFHHLSYNIDTSVTFVSKEDWEG